MKRKHNFYIWDVLLWMGALLVIPFALLWFLIGVEESDIFIVIVSVSTIGVSGWVVWKWSKKMLVHFRESRELKKQPQPLPSLTTEDQARMKDEVMVNPRLNILSKVLYGISALIILPGLLRGGFIGAFLAFILAFAVVRIGLKVGAVVLGVETYVPADDAYKKKLKAEGIEKQAQREERKKLVKYGAIAVGVVILILFLIAISG